MANISILLIVLLLKVVSSAEQRPNRTFHLIEKSIKQSEAQAACRENYTDLVTVRSEEENTALINLTNTLLPVKKKVLIGLQRSNYSSKWSNGDEVIFSALTERNWKMPCCAAMKTDGLWECPLCTERSNFMCYKQDQTVLTFSYHLNTDQSLNWYEAQSYCRKFYTDLVSIRDQEQNKAVKIAGMNSSTPFWIGLLSDEWEWADGGRSAYRNWDTNQPRSTSDCTQLNDGKWQTVPCNNVVGPVMCYSQELFSTVVSPKELRPNRTFHLIEKSMKHPEARAACRENYTDLATVRSEEENDALINLINTLLPANRAVWIGLQQSNYSSKWSNGDNVTFSNLTGSCGTKPCCAAMKTDGSWDNIMCTETRNFICYKQDQTVLTFSYHLITDQSLNWYKAQSYCRKNYTDLVSIRDQNQNEAVKIAGMRSSKPFWIGLLSDDRKWADGGRAAYRNWWDGQPRSTSDCTQLKNGKWQTVPCSNNVEAIMCYKEVWF